MTGELLFYLIVGSIENVIVRLYSDIALKTGNIYIILHINFIVSLLVSIIVPIIIFDNISLMILIP
mgnify:CR=1 FL=1